jgi:hypothetical protein
MKRLCLFISFIIVCGLAKAQQEQPPANAPGEKIEALKVAFISKDLNLTPQEAEKFWPIYNQYSAELRADFKYYPNVIDRDEHVLNTRKRYNEQFIKIIGPDRTNTLFSSESRFRQLLIRIRERQNGGHMGGFRMHRNFAN